MDQSKEHLRYYASHGSRGPYTMYHAHIHQPGVGKWSVDCHYTELSDVASHLLSHARNLQVYIPTNRINSPLNGEVTDLAGNIRQPRPLTAEEEKTFLKMLGIGIKQRN